jgi:hypothetical protein
MHIARALLILLTGLALGACSVWTKAPSTTDDGLERVEAPWIDKLYVDSKADFAAYDSLYIEKLSVEFDRGWQNEQNRSDPGRVRQSDMDRISERFDEEFVKIFAGDIAANNSYEIVSTPGPRTLVIKPAITNLRINNPVNNQPYSITVLSEEVGSMRINIDMIDNSSDKRVLTMSDFTRGRNYAGTLLNQNVTRNKNEATWLLRRYARSLNEVLTPTAETGA